MEMEDGLRADPPQDYKASCHESDYSDFAFVLCVCSLCGFVQGWQDAMVKPFPYRFQNCESCFLSDNSTGDSMGSQIPCYQNCVILQTSKAKPPPVCPTLTAKF